MFLPAVLSRGFHRLDDRVRGRGVWSALDELRASERSTRDRLDALQSAKLQTIVAHAAKHSPYYARVFAERGLLPSSIRSAADLAALPLLTRELVREHGDAIRSRGVPDDEMLPNSTGGSTGSNVKFWVDRECWRRRDAATMRTWELLGLTAGEPEVVVWGSPMDLNLAGRLRNRVRSILDNKRVVSAYRLHEDDLRALAAAIGRLKPRVLRGYPSVIDLLATRVRQGAIPWTPIPGLIVVSAAEALYPEQRANIAEVLSARVVNLYGCREFGHVAIECREAGSLHVYEERVLLELLPADDGAGRRIVITDLDNRAFPLIRYEIGDLAEPGPAACRCGRRLMTLGAVAGRTFDVIRSSSGRAVGGTFWSLLLRTAVQGIETWQVVQVEPDAIEIRVTPPGALTEAARATIQAAIREALGGATRVSFAESEGLEPLASGKHRFVVAHPDARAGR